MTDSRRARLEARVKAVNTVNTWANKLGPILRERFRPLVGQKVLKIDGSLLEKYKPLAEITLPDKMHRGYRDRSDYSLCFQLDVCVSIEGQDSCLSERHMIYVGDIKGQVLASVYPAPLASDTLRTTYTADEVTALRAEYDRLQKIAKQAEYALYPFGEYDR